VQQPTKFEIMIRIGTFLLTFMWIIQDISETVAAIGSEDHRRLPIHGSITRRYLTQKVLVPKITRREQSQQNFGTGLGEEGGTGSRRSLHSVSHYHNMTYHLASVAAPAPAPSRLSPNWCQVWVDGWAAGEHLAESSWRTWALGRCWSCKGNGSHFESHLVGRLMKGVVYLFHFHLLQMLKV